MSINPISLLPAKIRKVVFFFHKSTTAAHVFKTKQELPNHKLIQYVPTKWNSSHDMFER
jgi:hypothetical protein